MESTKKLTYVRARGTGMKDDATGFGRKETYVRLELLCYSTDTARTCVTNEFMNGCLLRYSVVRNKCELLYTLSPHGIQEATELVKHLVAASSIYLTGSPELVRHLTDVGFFSDVTQPSVPSRMLAEYNRVCCQVGYDAVRATALADKLPAIVNMAHQLFFYDTGNTTSFGNANVLHDNIVEPLQVFLAGSATWTRYQCSMFSSVVQVLEFVEQHKHNDVFVPARLHRNVLHASIRYKLPEVFVVMITRCVHEQTLTDVLDRVVTTELGVFVEDNPVYPVSVLSFRVILESAVEQDALLPQRVNGTPVLNWAITTGCSLETVKTLSTEKHKHSAHLPISPSVPGIGVRHLRTDVVQYTASKYLHGEKTFFSKSVNTILEETRCNTCESWPTAPAVLGVIGEDVLGVYVGRLLCEFSFYPDRNDYDKRFLQYVERHVTMRDDTTVYVYDTDLVTCTSTFEIVTRLTKNELSRRYYVHGALTGALVVVNDSHYTCSSSDYMTLFFYERGYLDLVPRSLLTTVPNLDPRVLQYVTRPPHNGLLPTTAPSFTHAPDTVVNFGESATAHVYLDYVARHSELVRQLVQQNGFKSVLTFDGHVKTLSMGTVPAHIYDAKTAVNDWVTYCYTEQLPVDITEVRASDVYDLADYLGDNKCQEMVVQWTEQLWMDNYKSHCDHSPDSCMVCRTWLQHSKYSNT